jgi:hypothetical protein
MIFLVEIQNAKEIPLQRLIYRFNLKIQRTGRRGKVKRWPIAPAVRLRRTGWPVEGEFYSGTRGPYTKSDSSCKRF